MTAGGAYAARRLEGGTRLHLQHGPIDLIIGADGHHADGRNLAFAAAEQRFDGLLAALVQELPLLRAAMTPDLPDPQGAVARRMYAATRPFGSAVFVTAMAAVAGAVADEILSAMTRAAPLRRAYVNNGGDIALHLGPGARFVSAMRGLDGRDLGRIVVNGGDGIGGIATSGKGGRSLSLGIADSVTVLARTAAAADVAATLVANAVDLPGHPAVRRSPASALQPDSDLGELAVVTAVGPLSPPEAATALAAGAARAQSYLRAGRIAGAALFLQGQSLMVGDQFGALAQFQEVTDAAS